MDRYSDGEITLHDDVKVSRYDWTIRDGKERPPIETLIPYEIYELRLRKSPDRSGTYIYIQDSLYGFLGNYGVMRVDQTFGKTYVAYACSTSHRYDVDKTSYALGLGLLSSKFFILQTEKDYMVTVFKRNDSYYQNFSEDIQSEIEKKIQQLNQSIPKKRPEHAGRRLRKMTPAPPMSRASVSPQGGLRGRRLRKMTPAPPPRLSSSDGEQKTGQPKPPPASSARVVPKPPTTATERSLRARPPQRPPRRLPSISGRTKRRLGSMGGEDILKEPLGPIQGPKPPGPGAQIQLRL